MSIDGRLDNTHTHEDAYNLGYSDAEDVGNAAAFAAIRRAAELARACDALSRTQASSYWGIRADAMRAAIRAAIGSPKA